MIESPCIDVCEIDEASGLCQGCYRNLAEIAAWGNASDPERIAILAAVGQRREQRVAAARPAPDRADR